MKYSGVQKRGAARAKTVRKVLLLVRLKHSSGRNFLTGVFHFLSKGNPWQLKLLQESGELTPETVLNARREGVDGIILTLPVSPESSAALAACDIPAVFVNIEDSAVSGRAKSTFINIDNIDIGRKGANHLMSCGNFMSFAYVHATPDSAKWSNERAAAFRAALEAKGESVYEFPTRGDIGSDADRHALMDFLAGLPKPAAVMAAYDWRATQILDACGNARIEVPRRIAVLGVDDDEFCCPFSVPPLSSVKPDFFGIGARSASELSTLMTGRRKGSSAPLRMASAKVVARESTAPIPPATSLVRIALAYIKSHAHHDITPGDVARHLGVSRRLADLRFSELRGETLKHSIETERLSRVKQLLRSTERPIVRIAEETGFKSATHLAHLFKKRFSMTMLEFRNAHR